VSPESVRVHALADVVAGPRSWATISIEPHATRAALLKTLAYTSIFFLVLALANNRTRVLTLARVLVYSAVVDAIIAVLLHLESADGVYWGTPVAHSGSASWPFVNRNHLAGYLEMTLSVGIGLLIAGLSDRRAETWKAFWKQTIEWILSPKMILRLALCILV